jgi:hypothetical protein
LLSAAIGVTQACGVGAAENLLKVGKNQEKSPGGLKAG